MEQYNLLKRNYTSDQYDYTTAEYSSTSNTSTKHNLYNINYKLIAILAAGILFTIIIVRICIVLSNSFRTSANSLPNRRLDVVQPQIATIRQNTFKQDLPPAYTEAIANVDNDESKLPAYDELHNEQHTRSTITT